jgi:hypothetical protein
MLFTGASVVAAINSVVGGVGLALLTDMVASLATGAALAVGIAAAVVLFALHLLYQPGVLGVARHGSRGTLVTERQY